MPPAARVGDMTSHGSPLTGTGSADVLIGNLPAWRATVDMHTCPLSNGPQPHVGGMVAVGSLMVLINNFPAARAGDSIVEAGGPNSITVGEPTVMIG
jgi:uncharacterized Zn-binding protein involved in type VI secretion